MGPENSGEVKHVYIDAYAITLTQYIYLKKTPHRVYTVINSFSLVDTKKAQLQLPVFKYATSDQVAC